MDLQYHEQPRKLVLLGNTSVGKTAVLMRYVQNEFVDGTVPTVGASFTTKRIPQSDGTVLKLDLWDTAGQERYRSLIPMYYKDAAVAVVVYDVTSQDSFVGAKEWVQEVKVHTSPDVLIVLVGNKLDLSPRTVRRDIAADYAARCDLLYFEMSAKSGENVAETFQAIAREIYLVQSTPRSSLSLKEPSQTSEKSGCCW